MRRIRSAFGQIKWALQGHRRFQQWVRSGILKGVFEALAADLQSRGFLDLREAFIDGSFAPAKKGAEGREDEAW